MDGPVEIRFTVPAVPVAQPRQRHRVVQIADSHVATNYTPAKSPVNAYKATVRMAASRAVGARILYGPVSLSAVFVLPRPARLMWKTKPMPRVWHTSKPDMDNLFKSLKDALKGLLWRDDSQVARYFDSEKVIAAGDEQPHVEVRIRSMV